MKIIVSILLIVSTMLCYAQNTDSIAVKHYPAVIVDGDTLAYIHLNPFCFSAERVFKSKRHKRRWTRTLKNVKKVYPYAILASARLKEYDRLLATIPNEHERKKRMKEEEKKIKKEFGQELKNLTMTQGRILIKLIDRETGNTTYDLVKDMRGSLSAFMWQSVALMFNSNMKKEYDAENEDKDIEAAIKLIENGMY